MTEFRLHLAVSSEVLIAQIQGEVDFTNVADIEQQILDASTNDMVAMVLDLSETEYLDSAGVRMLFDLTRRAEACRQRLGIVVPQAAPLHRLLAVTNMAAVASICASVDQCIDALKDDVGDLL